MSGGDDRDRLRALRAELGAPPPPAFEQLDDRALAHLAEVLRDDRRRRAALLDAALERALVPLPRAARSRLKRRLLA